MIFQRKTVTNPISPMKAQVFTPSRLVENAGYFIQPKHDGHRMLVRKGYTEIVDDVPYKGDIDIVYSVEVWSSGLKDCHRKIDNVLLTDLAQLPPGVYDGELHLGLNSDSSQVTRLDKKHELIFTIFDCLESFFPSTKLIGKHLAGIIKPIIDYTYYNRLHKLEDLVILSKDFSKLSRVNIVESSYFTYTQYENNIEFIQNKNKEYQNQGYEGAVVKLASSQYLPGKRNYDWMKLKGQKSIEMFIVDYTPPITPTEYGTLYLNSIDNTVSTSVKVPNKNLRELFLKEGDKIVSERPNVLIEYMEMTKDKKLRHPRFDRFIDEERYSGS